MLPLKRKEPRDEKPHLRDARLHGAPDREVLGGSHRCHDRSLDCLAGRRLEPAKRGPARAFAALIGYRPAEASTCDGRPFRKAAGWRRCNDRRWGDCGSSAFSLDAAIAVGRPLASKPAAIASAIGVVSGRWLRSDVVYAICPEMLASGSGRATVRSSVADLALSFLQRNGLSRHRTMRPLGNWLR